MSKRGEIEKDSGPLTAAQAKAVVLLVEGRLRKGEIAKEVGVTIDSLGRWIRTSPEFRTALDMERAARDATLSEYAAEMQREALRALLVIADKDDAPERDRVEAADRLAQRCREIRPTSTTSSEARPVVAFRFVEDRPGLPDGGASDG